MLQTSLRVRCRNQRCRTKLTVPTSNDHKAFCSRYCYDQFYHLKCVVCEKPVTKRPRGKTPKWCVKRQCRLDYNRYRDAFEYKPHSDRQSGGLTQEVPVSQGAKVPSGTTEPAFRIIAGPPLSPSALWAATLPGEAATLALAKAARANWQGWPAGKPHQPGELATEWVARELARRNAEDEQYVAEDEERLRTEPVDDEGNYAVQPMEAA